jgi:hypothetical protein
VSTRPRARPARDGSGRRGTQRSARRWRRCVTVLATPRDRWIRRRAPLYPALSPVVHWTVPWLDSIRSAAHNPCSGIWDLLRGSRSCARTGLHADLGNLPGPPPSQPLPAMPEALSWPPLVALSVRSPMLVLQAAAHGRSHMRERTPWHATQRAAWEALSKTAP